MLPGQQWVEAERQDIPKMVKFALMSIGDENDIFRYDTLMDNISIQSWQTRSIDTVPAWIC